MSMRRDVYLVSPSLMSRRDTGTQRVAEGSCTSLRVEGTCTPTTSTPHVWLHEDLHSWGGLQQRGGSTGSRSKSKSTGQRGTKGQVQGTSRGQSAGQTLGAGSAGQCRPPHVHFRTGYHYNKEAVRDGYCEVSYVHTSWNLSDAMTKGLGSNKISFFSPYINGEKLIPDKTTLQG